MSEDAHSHARSRRMARYQESQRQEEDAPIIRSHTPASPSYHAAHVPSQAVSSSAEHVHETAGSSPDTVRRTPRSSLHGEQAPPEAGVIPSLGYRRAGMSRPKKTSPAITPLSPLMWAALVLTLLCTIGTFFGLHVMRNYITDQQLAREKAYQQVLEHHPLMYRSMIEQYAREFNLHPAYVSAIIMNESSFRDKAESSVGARGLMQLMPDTAEWIAGKLGISNYSFERMFDAESNIRFGCWYLKYLAGLFQGDPVTVACGYHAGQTKVMQWLTNAEISPDGRRIQLDGMKDGPTKTYARRVTQAYGIYESIYFSTPAAVPGAGSSAPDTTDQGAGV